MDESLKWLQRWYAAQCNEDWEHQFGVLVRTLDNPGWELSIDLTDTDLADAGFDGMEVERGEHDWLVCRVEQGARGRQFKGYGGPLNLSELLEVFKSWVERTAAATAARPNRDGLPSEGSAVPSTEKSRQKEDEGGFRTPD